MEINRREALASLAVLAASVNTTARAIDQTKTHVLILGAGLSGLATGYALKQLGIPFTILEAKRQPGGRVKTLRAGFADNLSAEAGATFIRDNHDLTLRYCAEFGLTLLPLTDRYTTGEYFVRGTNIRSPESSETRWPYALTSEERRLGFFGMLAKYIGTPADSIGDIHAVGWPRHEAFPLDAVSLQEFLLKLGASRDASELIRIGYWDLASDGPLSLSALSALRDWRNESGSTMTYMIKGGSDLLPRAFAKRLGDSIRYGCVAQCIEQNALGVRVHFMQTGEKKTLLGSHALCTLPFSVAKNLKFIPELSVAKRRVVDGLNYTSITRVYLQTANRFWNDSGFAGTLSTDLPIMWARDASVNQPGTRGILESYKCGKEARRAGALQPDHRVDHVTQNMEIVFPGLKDRVEYGITKVWDDDPFARGGYCYFKPGEMTSLWPHVSAPEGRIHFAGEHTSTWPGWMQGALASGLRAADEIFKLISKTGEHPTY